MKLTELKKHLNGIRELNFELQDGTLIPKHFHVTEVGQINKHFIDCGGTIRKEKAVNFQLWEAGDFDHRLAPEKLNAIISLSEKVLHIEDAEIEVEYQAGTIGKYGLDFNGQNFILTLKNTACLASDRCGKPAEKQKVTLLGLQSADKMCCSPEGGCC